MHLLKAQHYHITLCLEWETLRNFYSLIVYEQLKLLDNVNINAFQTLNLLFLGNYDHWVCPYPDQDLWSKITAGGHSASKEPLCPFVLLGFIGFFDALIMMQVILDDKSWTGSSQRNALLIPPPVYNISD